MNYHSKLYYTRVLGSFQASSKRLDKLVRLVSITSRLKRLESCTPRLSNIQSSESWCARRDEKTSSSHSPIMRVDICGCSALRFACRDWLNRRSRPRTSSREREAFAGARVLLLLLQIASNASHLYERWMRKQDGACFVFLHGIPELAKDQQFNNLTGKQIR